MVLSPAHWMMLSDHFGKDDHKVMHLTLSNIHLDDDNVEHFCKVRSLLRKIINSLMMVGHLTC